MGFHPLKTIGKKILARVSNCRLTWNLSGASIGSIRLRLDVATRWVNNSEKNLDEDSPYVVVMVLLSRNGLYYYRR